MGNVGVSVSITGGAGIPAASATIKGLFSWRSTIMDMKGYSGTIGGGYNFGPTIGADIFTDRDGVAGFTLNFGAGASLVYADVHAFIGYSYVYKLFNINDVAYSAWNFTNNTIIRGDIK